MTTRSRTPLITRPALLLCAIIAAGCASPRAGAPPGNSIDPVLSVETFDGAWRIVHETHFDTTFNGVDWVGVRDELRPRAQAATTVAALRRVIREMLARLGQSHFALIPREAANALDPRESDVRGEVGDIGFDMRFIDEQLVVVRVDRDGPAAAAGIRPGWVITAIRTDRVAELVAAAKAIESRRPLGTLVWARARARLQGSPGEELHLEMLDGNDRPVSLSVRLRPEPSEPVKLGYLPTIFARFEREALRSTPEGAAIGLIRFNSWMVPLIRQLDQAIDDFRELDGIVIDLRGNGGGVGAMVMGVAGHFLDERVTLGTMRTRTTELRFVANPRRVSPSGQRVTPFPGPVAVLTDRLSGSASEVFAGGMQSIERVRVFGDTTAGGVLPAAMDRLANGDVLYHAFADFETADSVRLEGRGVFPDEPVALTREDLLAEDDPVLRAAVAWIARQRGTSPSR